MSTHGLFFGGPPQQHHSSHHGHGGHSHNHHGGRSRRAPRMSSAHHHKQQHQQQMRVARSPKDVVEAAVVSAYRQNFEAARSFDLEDDELFCPFSLLTDDDLTSIHSSGSDRSSLSSGSPEQSPLQHQLQPTPTFMLPTSAYPPALSSQHSSASSTQIHQPVAQRSRKPIPIVNPATRTVASPPPSVSPARQMVGRVW